MPCSDTFVSQKSCRSDPYVHYDILQLISLCVLRMAQAEFLFCWRVDSAVGSMLIWGGGSTFGSEALNSMLAFASSPCFTSVGVGSCGVSFESNGSCYVRFWSPLLISSPVYLRLFSSSSFDSSCWTGTVAGVWFLIYMWSLWTSCCIIWSEGELPPNVAYSWVCL